MTPRAWIERPILSVEDAEALPVGTVAIDPEHTDLAAATTYGPGRAFIRAAHWEASDLPWHNDDDGAQWHDVVVGMTALVPVEAEEEVARRWRPGDQPEGAEEFTLCPGDPLPDWIDAIPTQRRLVTRWEDA